MIITIGLVGCGSDTPSATGELQFENPLDTPPLLEPTMDENRTKNFTLTMQKGTTEFSRENKRIHGELMGLILDLRYEFRRGPSIL